MTARQRFRRLSLKCGWMTKKGRSCRLGAGWETKHPGFGPCRIHGGAKAHRAWEKAFEVNPSESPAVRASCVEFVLAGLYAGERISRSQKHGRITYEVP